MLSGVRAAFSASATRFIKRLVGAQHAISPQLSSYRRRR
jgi:hypothetical protein